MADEDKLYPKRELDTQPVKAAAADKIQLIAGACVRPL
jgi:hypothetical protein